MLEQCLNYEINTNYACWLSIYIKDMVQLPELHPEIYREFTKGNFVVQQSTHEQTNKILKANGGISDLYDNHVARALHMLSAPDSARVVKEFEDLQTSQTQSTTHHEEAQPLQIRFLRDVKALSAVLREQGNSFLDNSKELVTLGSRDVIEHQVSLSLIQFHDDGRDLHANYVKTNIEKTEVLISGIIPHNNLFTFRKRPDSKKKTSKLGTQKQNTQLITLLFPITPILS